MSSMLKVPKPLNHKALRHTVKEYLFQGFLAESPHTKAKHSVLLADVMLGFYAPWAETTKVFDRKRRQWKYTIRTLGSNGKWLKIAFALDDTKKQIKIITRFQDEYGKTRLPKSPTPKKGKS